MHSDLSSRWRVYLKHVYQGAICCRQEAQMLNRLHNYRHYLKIRGKLREFLTFKDFRAIKIRILTR